MAKERLKSPRARLFIALDLPEEMRKGIEVWGRRELDDPILRPVARDSLHITLAFLGHRPEREIETLADLIEAIEAPAVPIELENPVARPSIHRARLFALPARSPRAVALQGELVGKLVEKRLYKAEKRPFWPHVTVARVKAQKGRGKPQKQVSSPPGRLPQALLQPASCRRVTLYRSELQPQGARYTPLAQVELSEDGRQ